MHQLISKKIIIYLFVFLILVTIKNNYVTTLTLPNINSIKTLGLNLEESNKIKITINDLDNKNIFYLKKKDLIKKMDSFQTIETFTVFKNYPSTLIIDAKMTKFLAITNIDGLNYFIGSNGKLIEEYNSKNDLPFIFGNFDIKEFLKFKRLIDNSNLQYDEIINFYFYKSKRWDIETSKGYIIKLPRNNIEKSLNLFVRLVKEEEFKEKKIIDFRQQNQIIFNEK